MPDSMPALLTAVIALLSVVGVILLIGRVLRNTSLGRPPGLERVLIVKDVISLGGNRRLYLVQHGEGSVLLLIGGQNDVVVGWQNRPPAP